MSTDSTLYSGTPEITVLGQQGQTLRLLRYRRTQVADPAEEQISRSTYDALWRLQSEVDARFFELNDGTLNFQHHNSLSGQALRNQSIDAGTSHTLIDIEGRPMWQRDARGIMQHYTYDVLGRLTQRSEENSATEQVRERLLYGESVSNSEQYNLRGQVAQHYDTAGHLKYSSTGYSLNGSPLQQQRRLLAGASESDWAGNDENIWQQALETDTYTTTWQYDALGEIVQQLDAAGHQQRYAYDVVGRLKASWVTANGTTEQAVLRSLRYNAAGLKLHEQAGNNVTTEYTYEPETQRLITIYAQRTTSASSTNALQNLQYTYDPVGNITAIDDSTINTSFFKNQTVQPSKIYHYDTLYQLTSTTGRENASLSNGHDAPDALIPIPTDLSNYTTYTRNHLYDRGGNLTKIQHLGNGVSYTRTLLMAPSSNHAILQKDTLTPSQVENFFDACGNQNQLDSGQNLTWNGLNQLHKTIVVERPNSPNDEQVYRYDSAGMRIQKTDLAQANNTTQHQSVIYLPGLELRRTTNGTTITENLEVVTIGTAGRCQVRLLNWTQGKPTDINNLQLRYSIDDHLGSSQLELDANATILTREEYYPYGGTAIRAAKSSSEAKYKTIRYSGKERDTSGLYYYGFRYYQPWIGRWLSPDPAGTIDGLNLYAFVCGNPITDSDYKGLAPPRDAKTAASKKITAQVASGYAGSSSTFSGNNLLKSRTRAGPKPARVTRITKAYKQGTIRIHFKGVRDPASGKVSGIEIDKKIGRSSRSWTRKHKALRSALDTHLKSLLNFTPIGQNSSVAAENSHIFPGSRGAPNDILSAPPASVHQNTEQLAIEQGVDMLESKGAAVGGQVVWLGTGYVHATGPLKGYMKGTRTKILIGGDKKFDHLSSGDRGNIDFAEASALKAEVGGLTSTSLRKSLGIKPSKGLTGIPPNSTTVQNHQYRSSNNEYFTDMIHNNTRYSGAAAETKINQIL